MELHDFNALRHTVTTRRGPVSYLDVGNGPVALFIHGVGTNALLWRNVIDLLLDERRCVALDLPLHGQTPAAPGQDFSLPGLVESIEALCDALGLESIDVVANDTGGALAQVFAVRNVPRLRSLTLTNCDTHDNLPPPAFKPTVEQAERGELSAAAPQLMGNLALARSIFDSSYEHVDRLPDEMLRAYLEPVLGTPERAREFERLLCSLRAEDLLAIEPRLRQLQVPTLVVWGTGDVFFERRWANWLRETIPGVSEVVELDGARLFFPDERASELAPHLRRHWSAARAAAPAAAA
jgi:pimeloyl-ACP methyl ester carboxylesterase